MSSVYVTEAGLAKCLPNLWPQFALVERFEPVSGEEYSALLAAQRFVLRQPGLHFGPPDRDELPIAVMNNRGEIAMWSKLRPRDLPHLMGVIYAENERQGYRLGPVVARLRATPGACVAAGGRA